MGDSGGTLSIVYKRERAEFGINFYYSIFPPKLSIGNLHKLSPETPITFVQGDEELFIKIA